MSTIVRFFIAAFGLPFLFSQDGLRAQNSQNTWFFGHQAGIDFSSGAPVPLTCSVMSTQEGCAAVSDQNGNLLFYTDGMTVWNKNHQPMPNGTGLTGNISTTQSALIVPRPGSSSLYYLFTADAQAGVRGVRYSEVDMSLCSGLGNVTGVKNVLMITPSCEKLAAIQHCNEKDVWIVTHDWNSDAFRTFLVTASGVHPTPVISHCGITISGSSLNAAGCLKGSPDGKKLASGTEDQLNRFELFDFDNSTGVVSNQVLFPQHGLYAYGVEFSRDGTRLYGTALSPAHIYQFNLCAGSPAAVANSGTIIGTASGTAGTLQLGPDDKIYLAKLNSGYLGVIDQPSSAGTACNYLDTGVYLGGKTSSLGLPNFISYAHKLPPAPFSVTNHCLNVQFSAPLPHPGSCVQGNAIVHSYHWDFGDPASGNDNYTSGENPWHTYTDVGTYTVTLIVYYSCSSDTLQTQVTVTQPGLLTISTTTACNDNTGTAMVTGPGLGGYYSYSWAPCGQTSATATGLGAGTYFVFVKDSTGCLQKDTATISFKPPPDAVALTSTLIDIGESVILHASGGNAYNWYPASGLSCTTCTDPVAAPFETTEYCVTVTDRDGCKDTACVTVSVEEPVFVPNAFTPEGDGLNDEFLPSLEGVHDYRMTIYDRWGQKIFETTELKEGWNGANCMQGVYVYRLTYTDNASNRERRREGSVTLVR
jgi:gliding motility-associated-like protein